MIFDSLKRLLGFDSSSTRSPDNSTPFPNSEDERRLVPFRQQLPPDIHQIESEFAHVHEFMEQQMRAMMGSFGFMYGSPFGGFGFGDNLDQQQNPSFPFSSGIEIKEFEGPDLVGKSPTDSAVLHPRDEVLKPEFRKSSPKKWTGQDQILDERFEAEGPASVLDAMKPSDKDYMFPSLPSNSFSQLFGSGLFRNGPFDAFGFQPTQESGSISSSSTVTIYSNVNGRTSVEKIIRHPDGKIERTVIRDDGSPQ